MTDKKHTPNDPVPLNDDDLAQVNGGSLGWWSQAVEDEWHRRWEVMAHDGEPFDQYIKRWLSDDPIGAQARDAFIKGGSQSGRVYFYQDGAIKDAPGELFTSDMLFSSGGLI